MSVRTQTPNSRAGHGSSSASYRKGPCTPTPPNHRHLSAAPSRLTPSTPARNTPVAKARPTRTNTAVLSSPRKVSAPATLICALASLDCLPSSVSVRRKISAPVKKTSDSNRPTLTLPNKNISAPDQISRDHGNSGSQSNLTAPGVSADGKSSKKATKDILPTVKEEKKQKKANKKSSAPSALVNTDELSVEKAFQMDNNAKRKYSQPNDHLQQPLDDEEPKLKRVVSDLIRSSETKTQEIAALKIEIGRLKENLREKRYVTEPQADASCAQGSEEGFERLVAGLTSENVVLRKHLDKLGVSLDASPICDQQKQVILGKNVPGTDGSTHASDKEWDAKSSSSISGISVACLQGRIQQMEETHYSTNEELQATLQELEDLKEQLTECQVEVQQLQEEKQVILESLTQQTEKLNEARCCNDSLKLMLIQQSENNQEISQCEKTQRLMELLKSVQEDRELHHIKQDELELQIISSKHTEERFHKETKLIRDRMKLLESMVEDANTEKRSYECQFLDSQETIKACNHDISRLEISLTSAKEKMAELEASVLSGEKSELADVLDRVTNEKDSLEDQLSVVRKEINSHTYDNDKLKDQLNGLQNEFKTMQNLAQSNLNDVEWQRSELDKKRRELGHEVDTLKTSMVDLQGTCQRHLQDKRQLKASLSEAQKKLAQVNEQLDEAQRVFCEERTAFSRQVEEWDQFQTDLLTTVRVANDFKTEAQQDVEKLQQENTFLKERLKSVDTDLERAKASHKMPAPSPPAPTYSSGERRLVRTVSSTVGNAESFLSDRRNHHRPLARGDSRVKSLIESIECATKTPRGGSRSSSTSSLTSSGSENAKQVPVLKRADTDSVIRNVPVAMKEATSPLRPLNCNISATSLNLPDNVKMSQLSTEHKSAKFNASFANSVAAESAKSVSILSAKMDNIARSSFGHNTSASDKKDPLACLAQRGDTKRNALLKWCQNKTLLYAHVDITNFSTSWNDGLAFCALLHTYLPDHIPYATLNPTDKKTNFDVAFRAAESVGIHTTLDPHDIINSERPNWQSVFNYVTSLFCHFET